MSKQKTGFDAFLPVDDAANAARNQMLADIEDKKRKRQENRERWFRPTPQELRWEEEARWGEAREQTKAKKAAAYRKRVIEGTGYDMTELKNLSVEQVKAAFEKAKEDFMFEQDVKKARVELLEMLFYYKDSMERIKAAKAEKIEFTKRLYAEGKANLPPKFYGENDEEIEDATRQWILTHSPITLEAAIKAIEDETLSTFDGCPPSYGISLGEPWRTRTILPETTRLGGAMLQNLVNASCGG